MLSLKAHLIHFLFRHRHLMKFKFRKEIIDWNLYESILRFRKEVEDGAGRFGKLPDGIKVSPFSIGDIPAEWIIPSQDRKDKVMLYFHGGGYVSGTCRAHRAIVAKFVKGSEVGALLFEYRLAPEHPFPAALEDSLSVYQWLLAQNVKPSDIVFVGDSSGGGLCLATILALRDQGRPLPAAAVAYSPVTDYTCSGESHRTNLKKCLAPEGTAQAFSKHYAGDKDPGHPYISPLFGDLRGLPPVLIHVGGDETLRDDSIRFAEKAKNAGVDITLRVGKGLFHCYPACAPLFPEATTAMNEICDFIRARVGIK